MSLFTDMIVNLDPIGVAIIFIILSVFIFSCTINLIVRRRYISIQNDLEKNKDNEKGEFKSPLLNKIAQSYKDTAIVNYNEVNSQAIIENCFNTNLRTCIVFERFIKHTVSILITLGLLGTFIGLTLAVTDLVTVFRKIMESDAVTDPTFSTGFLNELIPSVYSMGVAFTTSLFGIATSILFTIFNVLFSVEEARETLMVRIEEYLDNTVSLVIAKDKETEYNLMNRILRETFVEFGEKIENTLKQTVRSFGESLTSVVMDVNVTSKALDNTVEKFDLSLKNFASNIKDFTEFNNNLRNNIEKMDVSFIKVTEALTDTSEIISENYSSIENFSKDIKDAAEEMTEYNRQVIYDISNIVVEVKNTVSTINELSETIKADLSVRTEEIKEYHDKINGLMTKLGEEIDLLGEKTAEAFSKSLDESGKVVSQKVVESMDGILKEIFTIMDEFKENEKLLAKTITMLPDQMITYHENASAQINKQLDDVKRLLRNN